MTIKNERALVNIEDNIRGALVRLKTFRETGEGLALEDVEEFLEESLNLFIEEVKV